MIVAKVCEVGLYKDFFNHDKNKENIKNLTRG